MVKPANMMKKKSNTLPSSLYNHYPNKQTGTYKYCKILYILWVSLCRCHDIHISHCWCENKGETGLFAMK